VAVQVAERWILARLRHETFHALAALNARIRALLNDLNRRRMRHYQASRWELFTRLDRPAFRPLPASPFVYGVWKLAKVSVFCGLPRYVALSQLSASCLASRLSFAT